MGNLMNKEQFWEDVLDYEGLYKISDNGILKSLEKLSFNGVSNFVIPSKNLKLFLNKKGYQQVSLFKDRKQKSSYVHRLVAMSFIPNPKNKPCVNHINGIKDDNRVENLEWCTFSENNQHSYDSGLKLKPKGELSTKALLNDKKVLVIRRLYRIKPNLNKAKLSRLVGVSETCINNVLSRKSWNHI